MVKKIGLVITGAAAFIALLSAGTAFAGGEYPSKSGAGAPISSSVVQAGVRIY
ncbi:hypothetical protein ACFQ1S_26855 [Kibdelosporangium lantanae]|uniref:Uncharacterized protein n=1 Tax=Kibdelosporangium lantanae TaxID=1497396 RepID=A0ABW3MFQ8_9PSEU